MPRPDRLGHRHLRLQRPLVALIVGSSLLVSLAEQAGPSKVVASADAGEGRLIAVVGSGIDYTHAALGGAGDPGAFSANDPSRVEPGSFPTAKVVGGHDFAGGRYTSACPDPRPADVLCHADPRPDGDPLDREGGPGTAMASIAAGEASGGIPEAPASGAGLVALKVAGDPVGIGRETALYDEAIDWVLAFNRGEAVPGAPAGGGRIDTVVLDGTAPAGLHELRAAVARAEAAGLLVIAPVGDSGPAPFSASDLAAVPGILAVAASVGDDETTWGIRTSHREGEGGELVTAQHEAVEGGDWLPQLADIGPLEAEMAWYGEACNDGAGSPTDPAQDLREKIALIARGSCTFADKMSNAAFHGAVGVVMYTDQRDKTSMPCGTPCPVEPGIPGVMIDNPPGQALQALLEAGTSVTAALDADFRIAQTWLADTLVEGSGRGPGAAGESVPDVTAFGSKRIAAAAGTGDGVVSWTASQAAAASAAGLATSAEVADRARMGAVLRGHAQPVIFEGRRDTGSLARVDAQGAGRIHAADLEGAASVASLSGLDFGVLRVAHEGGRAQSLALDALTVDARGRIFQASFEPAAAVDQMPSGVSVSLDRRTLEVGGSQQLVAGIDVQPEALPRWTLGEGMALADVGAFRRQVFDGWIRLRELDAVGAVLEGGEAHSIPLHVIPRRSSCVRSAAAAAPDGDPEALQDEPAAGIRWVNDCRTDGVARAMPLIGSDPGGDAPAEIDIRAVGLRYGLVEPAEGERQMHLQFHVATTGARATPLGVRMEVLLDLDRDGEFDRILATADGADQRDGPNDRWVTVNAPIIPGSLEADFSSATQNYAVLPYDLGESVTVLAVPADDLLLDPLSGDMAFDFAVRARDLDGRYVDPRNPASRAEDRMPEFAQGGPRLGFDQETDECWLLEESNGGPLNRIGQDAVLLSNGEARMVIASNGSCAQPNPQRNPLLLTYPWNAGAQEQWEVWGRAGGAEPIYLPKVERP